MPIQQILEGTWEEIRSHDAELAGHRVRLIVVDGERDSESHVQTSTVAGAQQPTLAELLAGRIGNLSFDPPGLSENAEQAFGEIMNQKYRDGTILRYCFVIPAHWMPWLIDETPIIPDVLECSRSFPGTY